MRTQAESPGRRLPAPCLDSPLLPLPLPPDAYFAKIGRPALLKQGNTQYGERSLKRGNRH